MYYPELINRFPEQMVFNQVQADLNYIFIGVSRYSFTGFLATSTIVSSCSSIHIYGNDLLNEVMSHLQLFSEVCMK